MLVRGRDHWVIVTTGIAMGVAGVILTLLGNPENSGICVSCFIENSAGALGFHDNSRLQYLRPELPGFVIGSLLSAFAMKEFRPRGGSSPMLRFFSGTFLIVGCSIFIGCPIKLFIRLCAGDLTAGIAILGLLLGVWAGTMVSANGVELESPRDDRVENALLMPVVFVMLALFLFIRPPFVAFSNEGSSAQHAPLLVSLGTGALLGALAQRSRFCITGSLRDMLLMGFRAPQLSGLTAFFASATALALYYGRFRLSLYGQPGAHLDHLWSFLGMLLVGWISVVIGGCPFRQLVKTGEGDTDAALAVAGMFAGGAIVQSWGIAATAAGVSTVGKLAVLVGLVFVLLLSLLMRNRQAC